MKVKVLFFGATTDIVGKRSIEVPIGSNAAAQMVFEQLLADFPALKNHRLLFSVNQEYADGGTIVGDGDELAIFTAVSGG